ncbi:PIN domain-containing protein [Anaerolineales bacterium HSG6]|nr:PIN domain-containing protein [Anaerolineales bacterium HSG6]
MMKLFVDTWGWVNIFNRRETHHQVVSQYYREVRAARGEIYTSDYVLDETITLLFRRLPTPLAIKAIDSIQTAVNQGYLTVAWVTPERFERTIALRSMFQDKPLISFTDLSSMAIMQEFSLTHALTGDAHFMHVGLGFQTVP